MTALPEVQSRFFAGALLVTGTSRSILAIRSFSIKFEMFARLYHAPSLVSCTSSTRNLAPSTRCIQTASGLLAVAATGSGAGVGAGRGLRIGFTDFISPLRLAVTLPLRYQTSEPWCQISSTWNV